MADGLSLTLIAFVGFFLGFGPGRVLDSWKIWSAARRMKLRDKGRIPDFIDGTGENRRWVHLACTFCHTPARIGVTKEKVRIQFCWRCETKWYEQGGGGGGPGEREGIPEDQPDKTANFELIDLDARRKAG